MKSLTERVAKRWMQAESTDDPSESVGDVSPGVFVDLMAFFQAVAAYRALKGDEDPVTKQAATLVRRFQSDLVAGTNRYFEPLTDDTVWARLKPAVRILTRGTRGLDHASEQASAIRVVLGALHSKPQVIREVFSDSRSYAAAMRLSALSATDSAGGMLNSLAALTPASRLQLTRKWVRAAAEAANVAPSQVETVLADAENARHLGEDLHTVEVQLAAADPVSQRAADLQVEKQAILDQIEQVVADSPSPSVVLSSAATAVTQSQDYATQTAKRSKLSPDQERAMMVRGKAIIAAGAGSGKTATLASKVAYHVNELGVPPGAVIATSFSRKSAAELRRRISKYGADIPDAVSTGFGTTHSVAGKLLREYGNGGRSGMKSYQQTDLVRLAMEQVQMPGPGVPPPAPKSLFDVSSDAPVGIKFRDALQMAFDRRQKLDPWSKGFVESFFNPSDQWYARTMRATKNLTDPRGLSDKQVEIIKKVFNRLGIAYSPTTDPSLVAPAQAQAKMAAKDKNKGLREKYKFFSQPANEWFNLGLELVEEDAQGNKKPIPTGFFKNAISKFKGRAVSPSEAWALSNGAPEAAVYAAYEWLKGSKGETDFQGLGDFDDVLLDVSKMLLSSPRVMQQVQSRFKVVLVDEAQDLNRAQHLMFGLITGFVDPAKVPNIASAKKMGELAKDDGSMTADTYCFIGDDKQAIYEFRAADPEAFIDMSELVTGGAGFKTEVLKTNYRSGQLIVDAANRLISYNTKQIPMTCAANPQRVDKGGIEAVNFPPVEGRDMSGPAEWLANSIAETMEEGRAGGKGYDAFGVGLRSNAEAYTYGIELLKKGIPFRSKANFFGDPTTKALLYWLTIADEGVGGGVDRVNEAVLGARKAPASKLGDKFEEILTQKATGNYLVWLKDNWTEVYGSRSEWAMLVRSFVDNLLTVAAMKGSPSEQVLEAILDLTGHDGRSVRQVLVDRVAEDEDAIAELRAESPTGNVTDEEIESMAFAPIAPLKGLLSARADLTEAMKYVRQLQSANEKLAAEDDPDNKKAREPAVTLGTMHSWKGLEVENMYIPFVGGRFPRADADEEDLASERRLAYVAVTRGENRVVVMNIPTVRRTKMGPVTQTSQFVGELCVPPAVNSPFSIGDEDAEQEVMRLEEQMNRTASYLSDSAIAEYLSSQKGR